jgi:arylsulfatase A-like enzyme/Tfp pilus assembly protein PilF
MAGRKRPATPPAARSRRRISRGLVVSCAVGLGGIAALAGLWRQGAPEVGRDSLLLITLDTTRADRLGCYGYAKARTPHLDRLAAEGARFDRAVASAPLTLPSHVSIFTGQYPFRHGVRDNGTFYFDGGAPTLTGLLKDRGYRTAAFVSAFVLDRRYGLARGFDDYDDRVEGFGHVVRVTAERRGDRTVAALKAWLEGYAPGRTAPFFLWLHLYDPHDPYEAPAPHAAAFADAPYDGEIAFTDSLVGDVRATLERLGLHKRTLVAVVGDHGEDLGDHGEGTHGLFVYDATLRVPLILWRPDLVPRGRVVGDLVRTVDLAPTLLALLAAPSLGPVDGRSLLDALAGKSLVPAPAYAETLYPQLDLNWAPLRSVRDERFKFIEAPRPELFDLATDPGESTNLHSDQPQRSQALVLELRRLTGGGEGGMSRASLDKDAAERLAALGYVGGDAAGAAAADPGRDPKDMLPVYRKWRAAAEAVSEGRPQEAERAYREILAEDRDNVQALLGLGNALSAADKVDSAIEIYKRFVALVPASALGHQSLAICHAKKKDYDGALRETQAALLLDPRFTDARLMRAEIFRERGARERARAEMKAALEVDPRNPAVRVQQARHLAHDKRLGEARGELLSVLRDFPDLPQAKAELQKLQARGLAAPP